ncbi:family 20 glycosylhydrolase [Simiduia curdlanivorans]|uniref:beta-N-acetylhexosaminidase n=1 Tax=Simiduia curdlanivorans TaxID=1492769 RepID=A0ABV8V4G7_9GAMM|nr:family 20 glycosylhydrolase [Simiduia curdlanivorans]MDN3640204.1 family 20 glycosylhydrolase [Simiduia curdlanivorans]
MKLAYVLLLVVFVSGCGKSESFAPPVNVAVNGDFVQSEEPQPPRIIPLPASVKRLEGQFSVNAQTVIVATEDALPIAQYIQSQFGPATGYRFPIVSNQTADNAIALILDDKTYAKEAYQLTVTEQGVQIKASTAVGLFWGVQSLRQLFGSDIELNAPVNKHAWPLPAVDIQDQPAFSYRGMHLDVSRTFFPVSFIKQYIDLLAMHKLNYFHWHLTDDQGWRIEIKKYPRLTEVGAWRDETVVGHTYDRDGLYDGQKLGGFYSQAEIRDIVAYAQQRQVTIIPEVDVPGHASAILKAYPEYGCVSKEFSVQKNFGVFPEVLCPTEKTFSFLDDVFSEVVALFPSPYIHVGGDEVKTEQWQSCADCSAIMAEKGLKDYLALQGYFISRVEASINKMGRKIIGWDEILEGNVAPSATITSWRGIEGAIHAAKEGHDAIMAPGSHLYFDHYQSRSIDEPLAIHGLTPIRETYSFEVIPEQLQNTDAAKRILGAQGHLWTEYVRSPAKAEYMVLPRMSALAEVVWTDVSKRSWEDFSKRLPALMERFSTKGLNVAKSTYVVNAQVSHSAAGFRVHLSNDMPEVNIFYTLDGSLPNAQSQLYIEPLLLPKGAIVRARAQSKLTGEMYLERRLTLQSHKAVGAKVTLKVDADRAWNTQPEVSLVDGVLARDQIFQLDDWATFPGESFEAIVEFPETIQATLFNLGFNAGRFRHFYGPTALALWSSEDGENWSALASATAAEIDEQSVSASLKFEPTRMRYLKVKAENQAQRFSTEDSKMVPVTLYIDEIIVQ